MTITHPGAVAPHEALTVELLELAASADADLVAELCELVNDVYAVAEAGMWVDGTTRTTVGEVAALIAAGEILVARSSSRCSAPSC